MAQVAAAASASATATWSERTLPRVTTPRNSVLSHLAAFALGVLVGAVLGPKRCPPVPVPAGQPAPSTSSADADAGKVTP